MKRSIIPCLLLLLSSFLHAQNVETFTIHFTNSDGIRGEAVVKTKPSTVGYGYIEVGLVQMTITSAKNFSGNDLSEFGIQFPMQAKGYITVSGTGCIAFNGRPSNDCADFKSSESIMNTGMLKGILSIEFPQATKDKHNEMLRTQKINAWEQLGYVKQIRIDEAGGDSFREILSAIKTHEKKQKEEQEKAAKANDEKADDSDTEDTEEEGTEASAGSDDDTEQGSGSTSSVSFRSSDAPEVKTISQRKESDFERHMRIAQEQAVANENHNKRNMAYLQDFVNNVSYVPVSTDALYEAQSPQEVEAELKRTMQSIQQQRQNFNQEFAAYMNNVSSNTATTETQANQNMGALIGGAIGMGLNELDAHEKKKDAESIAKAKMSSFRDDLMETYEQGEQQSLRAAAFAFDLHAEQNALEDYYYYRCLQDEIAMNYSWRNADWATPSARCEADRDRHTGRSTAKNSTTLYQTAMRKIQATGRLNNATLFQDAARYFVNQSIKANPKNADALMLRAALTDDPLMSYADVLYAKAVGGRNFKTKYGAQYESAMNNFESLFYQAVYTEDISFLGRALRSTLYPESDHAMGSPIEYAIKMDKLQSFIILTKNAQRSNQSASATMKDLKGYMLLASRSNSVKVIDHLYKQKNVPVDADSYGGYTPLEESFYSGKKDAFNYLMSQGADHNEIRKKPGAEDFHQRMSELLCSYSIDQNSEELFDESVNYARLTDAEYITAVSENVASSRNVVAEKIAYVIADKRVQGKYGTMVHAAISKDNYSLLSVLVDNQYDLNSKNAMGQYPIDLLLDLNAGSQILRNLDKIDLNYNYRDLKGIPFIHHVIFKKSAYLNYFLKADVDVNAQGMYGWTLLHYATKQGQSSNVSLLLDAGASPDIEDDWGRTPLKICKEYYKSDKGNYKYNMELYQIKRMLSQKKRTDILSSPQQKVFIKSL